MSQQKRRVRQNGPGSARLQVARLLYWMHTLWVKLPVALLVVLVNAKGPLRGQWLPIRGQQWLKTEDGRYYRKEGKLAEI